MTGGNTEPHAHVVSAVLPAALPGIVRRSGAVPPVDTAEGLEAHHAATGFRAFLPARRMTTNRPRTAGDSSRVVADYAREASGHGAVYPEALFSPAGRVERLAPGLGAAARQACDAGRAGALREEDVRTRHQEGAGAAT
ncbi:hypothetical protein ACIRJR_20000 [Streptomyces sp. NPDC102402]|uniref:hypothetical protein n=1 Tax=Streptomyces sp. NPDC102402 TaxID=3366169 RepID=UPI0037FA5A8F